jgi:putative methionine-R-sulfoxide reductase with GAF domain
MNIMSNDDLVYRLRKRAEIRRQIDTRKSVQEGKPDRIADLLEEAADYIEKRDNLSWVGLTREDKDDLVYALPDFYSMEDVILTTEAKLKEKNT